MGNCLVIQQDREVIKIMRMDGQITRLRSPLKVHQALAGLPAGHAIADALPVRRHLDPAADMAAGRLYYLLPAKAAEQPGSTAVRVKLVVSKQELQKMLCKEGVSLQDMVSLVRRESGGEHEISEEQEGCRGWRPALESIPEANDS